MESMSNNEKVCPYCSESMSAEIYNDHLMCHQLENEENFNAQNNINPVRNNNSNRNFIGNRNHNNNDDSHFNSNPNNNENNLLTNIFGLFASPLQNQNNNSEVNRNNSSNRNNNSNNNSPNSFEFLSSLIGLNSNNNNNNNNNINNNDNQEEGNILQKLSTGLSNISNTLNTFGEIGNQLHNFSSNIMSNPIANNLFRAESLNENNISNNNNSSDRNERRINFDNNNNIIPFISVPFRDNLRSRPRIIIGGRRIHRDNRNHNHISSNEVDRIMELLPCSVLTEKKDGENKECIVCLSEFEVGESITTLPCVHIFHNECIKSWLKSNNHCPICKFEITLNSIMREN